MTRSLWHSGQAAPFVSSGSLVATSGSQVQFLEIPGDHHWSYGKFALYGYSQQVACHVVGGHRARIENLKCNKINPVTFNLFVDHVFGDDSPVVISPT